MDSCGVTCPGQNVLSNPTREELVYALKCENLLCLNQEVPRACTDFIILSEAATGKVRPTTKWMGP